MDRQVTIQNKFGLHARPAMAFVDIATKYQASIKVCKGDQTVDGKSIMQMLILAAGKGTPLTLIADGPDAADALDALEQLINSGFNEQLD
jgi:phosphocarrier protein